MNSLPSPTILRPPVSNRGGRTSAGAGVPPQGTSKPPPLPAQRTGAAIVLVLFFLALLVIMVVGLFDASRIDRSQSSQHLERTRAAIIARDGIERAVALLQRETVNPQRYSGETTEHFNARKRNWISQPGLLIVPEEPHADPTNISINQKTLRRRVELSSGQPSEGITYNDPLLEPTPLNIRLLANQNTTSYLITNRPDSSGGSPPEMKLRWIYIREDVANNTVSYDLSENPDLTNRAQPIIGRLAWWADDESTKINYNLAWKRTPSAGGTTSPNLYRPSHPSNINLMALTNSAGDYLAESKVDALHQWVATSPKRYFNSFADARQVESASQGIGEYLSYNQFELTHYNHDPDITFFGDERILLTTNRDLVPRNPDGSYARRFIDILREDRPMALLDPGKRDNIAGGQIDFSTSWVGGGLPNKFDAAVRMIMDYLSVKDWPVAPGQSFKDKYYSGGLAGDDLRLAQIAVNIIDYVRSKESPSTVVEPLRFGRINGKFSLALGASWDFNSLQGVSRGPLVTEMGAYIEKDPDPNVTDSNGNPLYAIHFKAEIHLPARYDIPDGIDLVPDQRAKPPHNSSYGWFIGFNEVNANATSNVYCWQSPSGKFVEGIRAAKGTDMTRIFKHEVSGGEGTNGTLLKPGKYVVVTKKFYRRKPWSESPTVRTAVTLVAPRSLNIAQMSDADYFLTLSDRWPRACVVPQDTSSALVVRMSDPESTSMAAMVSRETDDPRCGVHASDWHPEAINTFGRQNNAWTAGTPLVVSASNLDQPQQDTDADGNISDYSLYMPPPKGQGSNDTNGDNGRVTSVAELGYIHTGVDAFKGSTPWRTIRLQPNRYTDTTKLPDWLLLDLFSVIDDSTKDAVALPHGTAVGGRININAFVEPFSNLQRQRGLVALLLGATPDMGTAQAETIASNILLRTLTPTHHGNFGKAYGYPWDDPLPNAYDTPGEICEIAGVADDGESAEDRVRSIYSHITTRSGVFGIYTIGQALKQTPSGKLVVTGEQRLHAVVERYRNTFGTDNPDDDKVQLRTVYLRQLNK